MKAQAKKRGGAKLYAPTEQIKEWSRYHRKQIGFTLEEIAAQDGVSTGAIERSIRAVQIWRNSQSLEFANEAITTVVIQRARDVDSTLERSLKAETVMVDDAGNEIVVPDIQTQLKAVDAFTKLAETVQPKQTKIGGTNVQVGVVTNPQMQAGAAMHTRGYEEVLRNLRGKIEEHNQLPRVAGTVIEAEEEADEEVQVSADEH